MIELVLIVVILILGGLLSLTLYQAREERERLVNVIISKNVQDLRELELVKNTKITIEKPKEPDLVPAESLSDKEFDELIKEAKE